MVLSSITIPQFHDIEILSQHIHIVTSCIALELLPPLHAFVMFATLLFELFVRYHCVMLNHSGACNNEGTGTPLLQPALSNICQQFGLVDHLLYPECHHG